MPTTPPLSTLAPAYFDHVYAARADPWAFETSAYEKAKYAATIAALQGRVFENAFEIGCSIGVLTALLAPQCRQLLSVDVSDAALDQARTRMAALPHVRLQNMLVPHTFPNETFDLVVLSEVGYYWSREDLQRACTCIVNALLPGGMLLLVHWTPVVADYPGTGDAVHEHFLALCTPAGPLRQVAGHREPTYRMDVLLRTAPNAS